MAPTGQKDAKADPDVPRCWNCWKAEYHRMGKCPERNRNRYEREKLRKEKGIPLPRDPRYQAPDEDDLNPGSGKLLDVSQACYNCWEEGHERSNCPKPRLSIRNCDELRYKKGIPVDRFWKGRLMREGAVSVEDQKAEKERLDAADKRIKEGRGWGDEWRNEVNGPDRKATATKIATQQPNEKKEGADIRAPVEKGASPAPVSTTLAVKTEKADIPKVIPPRLRGVSKLPAEAITTSVETSDNPVSETTAKTPAEAKRTGADTGIPVQNKIASAPAVPAPVVETEKDNTLKQIPPHLRGTRKVEQEAKVPTVSFNVKSESNPKQILTKIEEETETSVTVVQKISINPEVPDPLVDVKKAAETTAKPAETSGIAATSTAGTKEDSTTERVGESALNAQDISGPRVDAVKGVIKDTANITETTTTADEKNSTDQVDSEPIVGNKQEAPPDSIEPQGATTKLVAAGANGGTAAGSLDVKNVPAVNEPKNPVVGSQDAVLVPSIKSSCTTATPDAGNAEEKATTAVLVPGAVPEPLKENSPKPVVPPHLRGARPPSTTKAPSRADTKEIGGDADAPAKVTTKLSSAPFRKRDQTRVGAARAPCKDVGPKGKFGRCWNCWQPGHRAPKCNKPKISPRDREMLRRELGFDVPDDPLYLEILARGYCQNCWDSFDHISKECPQKPRSLEEKEKTRVKMGVPLGGAWRRFLEVSNITPIKDDPQLIAAYAERAARGKLTANAPKLAPPVAVKSLSKPEQKPAIVNETPVVAEMVLAVEVEKLTVPATNEPVVIVEQKPSIENETLAASKETPATGVERLIVPGTIEPTTSEETASPADSMEPAPPGPIELATSKRKDSLVAVSEGTDSAKELSEKLRPLPSANHELEGESSKDTCGKIAPSPASADSVPTSIEEKARRFIESGAFRLLSTFRRPGEDPIHFDKRAAIARARVHKANGAIASNAPGDGTLEPQVEPSENLIDMDPSASLPKIPAIPVADSKPKSPVTPAENLMDMGIVESLPEAPDSKSNLPILNGDGKHSLTSAVRQELEVAQEGEEELQGQLRMLIKTARFRLHPKLIVPVDSRERTPWPKVLEVDSGDVVTDGDDDDTTDHKLAFVLIPLMQYAKDRGYDEISLDLRKSYDWQYDLALLLDDIRKAALGARQRGESQAKIFIADVESAAKGAELYLAQPRETRPSTDGDAFESLLKKILIARNIKKKSYTFTVDFAKPRAKYAVISSSTVIPTDIPFFKTIVAQPDRIVEDFSKTVVLVHDGKQLINLSVHEVGKAAFKATAYLAKSIATNGSLGRVEILTRRMLQDLITRAIQGERRMDILLCMGRSNPPCRGEVHLVRPGEQLRVKTVDVSGEDVISHVRSTLIMAHLSKVGEDFDVLKLQVNDLANAAKKATAYLAEKKPKECGLDYQMENILHEIVDAKTKGHIFITTLKGRLSMPQILTGEARAAMTGSQQEVPQGLNEIEAAIIPELVVPRAAMRGTLNKLHHIATKGEPEGAFGIQRDDTISKERLDDKDPKEVIKPEQFSKIGEHLFTEKDMPGPEPLERPANVGTSTIAAMNMKSDQINPDDVTKRSEILPDLKSKLTTTVQGDRIPPPKEKTEIEKEPGTDAKEGTTPLKRGVEIKAEPVPEPPGNASVLAEARRRRPAADDSAIASLMRAMGLESDTDDVDEGKGHHAGSEYFMTQSDPEFYTFAQSNATSLSPKVGIGMSSEPSSSVSLNLKGNSAALSPKYDTPHKILMSPPTKIAESPETLSNLSLLASKYPLPVPTSPSPPPASHGEDELSTSLDEEVNGQPVTPPAQVRSLSDFPPVDSSFISPPGPASSTAIDNKFMVSNPTTPVERAITPPDWFIPLMVALPSSIAGTSYSFNLSDGQAALAVQVGKEGQEGKGEQRGEDVDIDKEDAQTAIGNIRSEITPDSL